MAPSNAFPLSPEQRTMYASEQMTNFRFVSKLTAKCSSYTLTDNDLASVDLQAELADIGQFAELAYTFFPLQYVLENLSLLSQPGFPLEGYDGLRGSILVSSFNGEVADLFAHVIYRPHLRQLVVGICGTSSLKQVGYVMQTWQRRHSVGKGCKVHAGFWKLYQGIRPQALAGIKMGILHHTVDSLVITGHSMGGAMSQLLALDIVGRENDDILPGITLKIVVFGAPRLGNANLAEHWLDLLKRHRGKNGDQSIQEYSVKAYKDGVCSIPSPALGYRHLAKTSLYFVHGSLYHIPESESEYSLFHYQSKLVRGPPDYPRGGHNYYNGRDMERTARRMAWAQQCQRDGENWEERYKIIIEKQERTKK